MAVPGIKPTVKKLEDRGVISAIAGNDRKQLVDRVSGILGVGSNRPGIKVLHQMAAYDPSRETASGLFRDSSEGIDLDSLFEALGTVGELELLLTE